MSAIPAYILAGGRSRRFGSDKARAEFDDRPLIARLAGQLSTRLDPVVVVAESAGKYADLNLTTIADARPGQGPLGGLVTALVHRQQTLGPGWCFVAACDTVAASLDTVDQLTARLQPGHTAVVFRHQHWEPLWACYHTEALALAQARLHTRDLSLQRLLDELPGVVALVHPGADLPRQVNTPEELAALEDDRKAD